jgi:anti-sigma factor RsiW
VKDLAAQGYPLAGGRLEYLGERGVMALVYRRRGHVINLFVWPDSVSAESLPRADSLQGYNLVHFSREGMTFWSVSDLNAEELKAFAALL